VIKPEAVEALYPIGALAVYPSSGMARVLRSSGRPAEGIEKKEKKRGKITYLSQKSLNRLIFLTQISTIELTSMLTLTYLCPPSSGKEAKADLRRALGWIQRRKKKGCNYVWFAEFTKAGSIHFHLLLDCLPTYDDRVCFALYWLRKTDQGRGRYCSLKNRKNQRVAASIFSSVSHPNSWTALRSLEGGKRYVAKYASKPYQKQVPEWFQDIGRFWGMSKAVRTNQEKAHIIAIDENELRDYLNQNKRSAGQWDVLPKYLWGVSDIIKSGYGQVVMSTNT